MNWIFGRWRHHTWCCLCKATTCPGWSDRPIVIGWIGEHDGRLKIVTIRASSVTLRRSASIMMSRVAAMHIGNGWIGEIWLIAPEQWPWMIPELLYKQASICRTLSAWSETANSVLREEKNILLFIITGELFATAAIIIVKCVINYALFAEL